MIRGRRKEGGDGGQEGKYLLSGWNKNVPEGVSRANYMQ